MSLITGYLKDTSPLRAVFPDGKVPLTGLDSTKVILGDDKLPTEVYLLATVAMKIEQKQQMAEMLHKMGQGTVEECLASLTKEGAGFPIRVSHFAGAPAASLRAFI